MLEVLAVHADLLGRLGDVSGISSQRLDQERALDLIGRLTYGQLVRINRATWEIEPWLAESWISDFTNSTSEAGFVKAGNIPNSTSLLSLVKGTPGAALAKAAQSTWFVPTAKNWTNVENANVLRTMLTNIVECDLDDRVATLWAELSRRAKAPA